MATFRLIFPPLNQYLSRVTNLFLPPPDIIRSMYYTNCLIPVPKITGYNLRLRGHGLTLPDLQSSYRPMRKNFLNRMLYSDIY